MRIFRIRIGDHFVLFERPLGLPVILIGIRQSADRVQIVAIKSDGVLIRLNGFLVIFLLIVSAAERGIQFRRPAGLGNGCQRLGSLPIVTFLVVEHR